MQHYKFFLEQLFYLSNKLFQNYLIVIYFDETLKIGLVGTSYVERTKVFLPRETIGKNAASVTINSFSKAAKSLLRFVILFSLLTTS